MRRTIRTSRSKSGNKLRSKSKSLNYDRSFLGKRDLGKSIVGDYFRATSGKSNGTRARSRSGSKSR